MMDSPDSGSRAFYYHEVAELLLFLVHITVKKLHYL